MHKSFSWTYLFSKLLVNLGMFLSDYHLITGFINVYIVIVEVPEAYDVILSGKWSSKLQGYFFYRLATFMDSMQGQE